MYKTYFYNTKTWNSFVRCYGLSVSRLNTGLSSLDSRVDWSNCVVSSWASHCTLTVPLYTQAYWVKVPPGQSDKLHGLNNDGLETHPRGVQMSYSSIK